MLAVEARLDGFAHHEHGAGGAVIRAAAGVLFHAASKFAEHHQCDIAGAAHASDVLHKRVEAFAQASEQILTAADLARMRVETRETYVIHSSGKAGRNQRSHFSEIERERGGPVGDRGLVFLDGLAHAHGAILGSSRNTADKIERGVARFALRHQLVIRLALQSIACANKCIRVIKDYWRVPLRLDR